MVVLSIINGANDSLIILFNTLNAVDFCSPSDTNVINFCTAPYASSIKSESLLSTVVYAIALISTDTTLEGPK